MKLSMMSYTVAKQKEHFDLERMLRLTQELELDGIDFVTLHNTDPKELRRMADDHGVPVVCHTFPADIKHADAEGRKAGLETCRRGFDAANILGAPIVMIPTWEAPEKTAGLSRSASRALWIAGLRDAVPLAEAVGLTLTIENTPGAQNAFVTAADFLEAAEAVPGLRLTFDAGNAATGEDPVESFARCADHAVHAHFKDWDIQDQGCPGHSPMLDGRYYARALIGEGDVDHGACLAAMKEAGYDGCINLEYDGTQYDPYEATRRAAAHLRACAAAIGY